RRQQQQDEGGSLEPGRVGPVAEEGFTAFAGGCPGQQGIRLVAVVRLAMHTDGRVYFADDIARPQLLCLITAKLLIGAFGAQELAEYGEHFVHRQRLIAVLTRASLQRNSLWQRRL